MKKKKNKEKKKTQTDKRQSGQCFMDISHSATTTTTKSSNATLWPAHDTRFVFDCGSLIAGWIEREGRRHAAQRNVSN